MRPAAVPAPLAVTVAVAALTLSGCSALFGSGADLLEQVRAAPVPEGAREVSTSRRDGDFERTAAAVVEYGLPQDPATACPLVLQGLADADYRLETFTVPPQPVTDIAATCAAELADDPGGITSVVVQAVPPGLDSADSFGVVLVAPDGDNPYPEGTTLRYDA